MTLFILNYGTGYYRSSLFIINSTSRERAWEAFQKRVHQNRTDDEEFGDSEYDMPSINDVQQIPDDIILEYYWDG